MTMPTTTGASKTASAIRHANAAQRGNPPALGFAFGEDRDTTSIIRQNGKNRGGCLDLGPGGKQTRHMAHIYMTFDFGMDEEKAQQARHKLDGWKQAFRLDKKLIYKFERAAQQGDGAPSAEPAPAKMETAKAGKGKAARSAATKRQAAKEKEETTEVSGPTGPVKLHLRLAFSGHEKITEERWLKRIPTEAPFKDAAPETVKVSDPSFAEIEGKFEALGG